MIVMKIKSIVILIVVMLFPGVVYAIEYPELYSEKVLVYDITDDKMLHEVNARDNASIASLTKIMTTIVAIENIDNLDEEVIITNKMLSTVRWDASTAGLKSGDKVTYEDLLYASILPSGADATNSLAILTSGSIDAFVDKMNELAKKLEMNSTHYENVTGLDADGHYSSAQDVLKLLKYSLKNETFKKIYTSKTYTLSNGLKVESTINKYNRTLGMDTSKIIGSKTGFTLDAGLCISVYFKSKGHEIIIVTLKAPRDKNYNLIDALNVIDFVDNNYDNHVIVSKDKVIKSIKVENSNIEEYNVTLKDDVRLFLENDYEKDKVNIEYDGIEVLSFLNKKDEKLGKVSIYYDKELILEDDIYLNKDINVDIFKILKNNIHYIIVGLVIVLGVIKIKSKG